MIYLILILLCVCIALIISMWLCLGGQMIDMKEDLSDIKLTVNYTSDAVRDYFLRLWGHIDNVNKHLTTEIACLATKNNEDIKRMKGGYEVGDVLKFSGIEYYVFYKTKLEDERTRLSLFGQNGDEYRMYTDDMPEDIEFVRHVDVKTLFS